MDKTNRNIDLATDIRNGMSYRKAGEKYGMSKNNAYKIADRFRNRDGSWRRDAELWKRRKAAAWITDF